VAEIARALYRLGGLDEATTMRGFLRTMLWGLALLGGIGLVVYFTLLDAWIVPEDDPWFTASILPNLRPGDRLLISKTGALKPGYLVRCADPDAPGRFVVGRVVAAGGDQIEIGDTVLVNGKRNPSPRSCTERSYVQRHPVTGEDVRLQCAVEDTNGNEHEALRDLDHPLAPVKSTVESGKLYLVSDDRHLHLDSRDFGQVDPTSCQHVVYRLWGESYFDASRRFNFLW
jgi:signal peptidase I